MATPHDVDRQAQFIRLILFILGAILSIVGWARFAGAQPAARRAVPLEPVAAIVDAFRTHRVVAVTAGHGETRVTADVALLQPDAASWPVPSIAIVRGTVLGAADFTAYYGSEAMGRFAIRDGKPDFTAPIARDQWRTLRAEDQFDAVLYAGKGPSPTVDLDPARCADKSEIQEHLRRAAVTGLPPNRLKQLCGL